MRVLPQIPEVAPFTLKQRFWLNGYLAALFPEAVVSGTGTATPSTATQKRKITILYASQSGNSETLAETFSERLSGSGFHAPVIGAEDFAEIDLTAEETLVVISSTWGEGDPPDNAVEFWNSLTSDDHPRLEQLKFAVLGLGDSNYLEFCGMGKKFDRRLEELGASRLIPRGDCDTDFEEPASQWCDHLMNVLAADSGEGVSDQAAAPMKTTSGGSSEGYSKKNPFPAQLLMNRRLNGPSSARDTRHFEISLAGSGLSYEVGDVLGVFPQNHPQAIDELVAALAFDGDRTVCLPGGPEVTLRQALIEHYDIRTVSRPLLEAWAELVDSDSLRQLLAPESDSKKVESYLWGREMIDLVYEFRPRFSDPLDFLALLRKLGPRLYSISSSPKAHPDEVHLTIARVAYEAHDRKRYGVCSTFLSDRVAPEGEVKVFLQEAKHFKLPTDLDTPVIMVGPGTGIAPFRAFLEERRETGAAGGNWLFFGNPHEDHDFLYRDQLEAMLNEGVLQRLDTAWSRDQEQKIYVQDRMIEAGSELWNWLDEGAHFYVCGDARRMAKDVDDALHAIIVEHGKLSEGDAAAYVANLKKTKRYQRDVY